MDESPAPTSKDTTARARAWPKPWMGPFLAALSLNGIVTTSSDAARINRCTAYEERETNEEFRVAWEEAIEVALDRAEAELYTRAVNGWSEPVYQGGAQVGLIVKKSDRCLELLLTARRRGTYGNLKDRQNETRSDAPARKVTFTRKDADAR